MSKVQSSKFKVQKSAVVSFLFFLFTLHSSLFTLANAAESPLAALSKIEGRVRVKRSGFDKWRKIRVGSFLYEGDTVKTLKKSKAVINFISGVEIDVNESTEFSIKTKEEAGTKKQELDMILGEILSKVKKGADYSVKTPQAVTAVRGTHFGVKSGNGMTSVYVLDGVVDVFNSYGKISCNPGQETTVSQGKAPEPPTAAEEKDLDEEAAWQIKKGQIELGVDLNSEKGFIAGVPLEVALTAEGDYSGKLDINTSPSDFRVTKTSDWAGGKMKFYCLKDSPGPAVLNINNDDIKTVIMAVNFEAPKEKELKMKFNDGRELNIKFKR